MLAPIAVSRVITIGLCVMLGALPAPPFASPDYKHPVREKLAAEELMDSVDGAFLSGQKRPRDHRDDEPDMTHLAKGLIKVDHTLMT